MGTKLSEAGKWEWIWEELAGEGGVNMIKIHAWGFQELINTAAKIK